MGERRVRLRDEAGFSLVETVVAFAILSLVMATAIQVVGGGSTRARIGQDRAVALAHAQSSLAALSASETVLPRSSSGTFADGFAWTLSVRPVSEGGGESSSLSPYIAEVSVTSPRTNTTRVVLRTIVLGRSMDASR